MYINDKDKRGSYTGNKSQSLCNIGIYFLTRHVRFVDICNIDKPIYGKGIYYGGRKQQNYGKS